jgi:putative hydrolase of the HAD superfamily
VSEPGPSGVRAVLFDLDNTLVDFLRMKRTASDAAARAMVVAGADFGFPADKAGDVLWGEYLDAIEGDGVFAAFLAKHHRQRLGLGQHHVDRLTAAAVNAYLKAKMLHTEPYAGVRPTLVALTKAGLRLGVLTDAPRFKAYQRLEAAGLADFFEFVVCPDDSGARKPMLPAFKAALDLFGLPPTQVLMVGDWPEKDMAGAKAAGMRTAWARYGKPSAPVPPEAEWVLDAVEGLIPLLRLAGPTR